jgi:hypothetical protein
VFPTLGGESICDGANEQESEYIQKPEVKIVIPDVLKLQLVDDWENVTKNNQASHLQCHGMRTNNLAGHFTS